jgi:lipopolysaccharide transport system permease protein
MDGENATASAPVQPHIKIRTGASSLALDLVGLWQYRMMIWLLIVRDFKIRYRQSAMGAVWIVLHPFFSVIMYTFIFGTLARMPSDDVPYALFNYVGLIPWIFFSNALPAVAQSLVSHSYLIQKVYFPRILLPIYAVCSCISDLIVMLVIQFGVLWFTGFSPSWHVIFLPFYIGWAVLLALSVGLGLAALQVRYRDVSMALGYLLQLWFYSTPIAYPTSSLPRWLQPIAAGNPMTWIVNGFRWSMLHTHTAPRPLMFVPFAFTLIVLACGYVFFRRAENGLVDII